MAKIVKKKRKLKTQNLIGVVFVLSLLAYLCSSLMLRSENVSLNYELEQLKSENQMKQKELDTLRLEVAKYTEREYLLSICAANGVDLNFDADRITYINEKE